MIKHGATIGGTATPEWNAWANMKKRCLNSRNPKFKHYGGRGIRIDEKWLGGDGFIHFREDLGLRPSPKHSLHRIDGNGHYCKDNCIWALPKTQGRSTRRVKLTTKIAEEIRREDYGIPISPY
jgi:hypothetical protein